MMMEELISTGVYETFSPEETTTVGDIVAKLGLEGNMFGVLVNGKKAKMDRIVSKKDGVVILPHLAGG